MAIKTYLADQFQPDFGIPWVPIPKKDELMAWPQEKLVQYLAFREECDRNAVNNPVGQGWIMPSWKKVMDNWKKYPVIVILGGNRCVAADTLIYDPVKGKTRRISRIKGDHHVLAWDGTKLVTAKAEQPFIKGVEQMYSLRLSNLRRFESTANHRVMLNDGTWTTVSELKEGSRLLDPSDNVDVIVEEIVSTKVQTVWDMTVPNYENYEAAGVIHHNSAKSTLASRLCVWAAGTIPNAEVRAYHVNEDRSIEDQQRMIYDALPVGIKDLPTKKGIAHSLQYSQKNGFTDNICILPPLKQGYRGGQIKFANYRQYQADAQVAEGFKSHFIWCDEECPQKLFETLQYRTIDYHGRIVLTFTTLSGWTPLVQDILGKTRTLESKHAPLLGRPVPVIQESLSRPGTIIYYFHTEDNAFIDTSDFIAKIKGRPKDEILARAYGIPTKSVSSAFPGFNKEVNVIPHDNLPWKKDPAYKVTRYMAIDPAGSKNWFMLWVAIDASGTWWVYREWPDYDDWAIAGSTAEGKPGPAQRGTKKGIQDYVELIKNSEDGEAIYERLIDPRLGAAEKQTAEGASTIIGDLDKFDMTFIPAPGVHIDDGLQLINNLLSYDDTKPIDSLNAPKLFISDRCTNLIYAMGEYTAKGGKDEATKDPIDCLRYLCVSKCEYYDEMDAPSSGGRTFSY